MMLTALTLMLMEMPLMMLRAERLEQPWQRGPLEDLCRLSSSHGQQPAQPAAGSAGESGQL